MNLLLDTEAFIFWTTRPEQLPARAHDAIRSRDNTVYLSVVSAWEMQIKFDLKKLELRQPPGALVRAELDNGAFTLLSVTLEHIDRLAELPQPHHDPLDRLLIAQAVHDQLTIVTGDRKIAAYPAPVLWQ